MMVVVQGTSSVSDYTVFLRAMSVAISGLPADDPYFYVYTAGPANINAFVSEFCNLSERGMKARNKKIKFYKVAPSWVEENLKEINYFAYLSKPGEKKSGLVSKAEQAGVDVGLFQY